MAPYYMVMRLPGEPRAEFILMVPMTPSQRDNMIAWEPPLRPAALRRADRVRVSQGQAGVRAVPDRGAHQPEHGHLAAAIPVEPARVTGDSGNLHAVPIEDSILYVSPLYLRAETGHIPELKRVIAAYGDHVVMEETLAEALAALFRPPSGPLSPGAVSGRPGADHAREALLGHYTRAMERLKAGDWGGFGTELEAMRALLEEKPK